MELQTQLGALIAVLEKDIDPGERDGRMADARRLATHNLQGTMSTTVRRGYLAARAAGALQAYAAVLAEEQAAAGEADEISTRLTLLQASGGVGWISARTARGIAAHQPPAQTGADVLRDAEHAALNDATDATVHALASEIRMLLPDTVYVRAYGGDLEDLLRRARDNLPF